MGLAFPDPKTSGPDGLVLVGGRPTAENLKLAYAKGIFPWPQEGLPLLWFSPPERGVLDFRALHLGRSFRKVLLSNEFEIRFDTAFEQVMRWCARSPRKGSQGTWITEDMIAGYCQAHREGWAHSVEVLLRGELVGGIYGVRSGGYFSAESMFYRVSSASKVALIFLMMELKIVGLSWLDIQMITPVTESLGGRYIPRQEFLERIASEEPMERPFDSPSRAGALTEKELEWIVSP